MGNVDEILEHISLEAVQAAKEGRWDRVMDLYHQRSQNGLLDHASPETVKKLMEWDRWMIDRVKDAHAGTRQQISDLQDRRRRLAGVKRQWAKNTQSSYIRHLQTI